MTQEDKKLLLKELSIRLPYGIIVIDNRYGNSVITEIDTISNTVYCFDFDEYVPIEKCLPYLRPMSSMTDEEKEEFHKLKQFSVTVIMPNGVSIFKPTYTVDLEDDGLNHLYDWLNKHHFDYRGLIEKGLAIAVTKENNPYTKILNNE